MKGITFSLLSGFLAATASLCGKFSMAAEKALMFCETFMENLPSADNKKTSFSVTPVCQNVLFITRAVYGQVFFGETVTFLWWLGTTLIITGLTLMHKADEEEPPPVEREENNSSDKVKSE
ncbi:transmembrane protein 42 [Trichonephila clavata]|uniref:Transmembrane protein 42 n=1 Tax=Trichonephila clavata TaxID=2740835 RepID=A0A8X6L5W7_TRICU|nr:transmembrane protein 42 [Trichonephila clavata]